MPKQFKKGDKLWYKARQMPQPLLGTLVCITTEPGKILGLEFDVELPKDLAHLDLDGRGKKGFCVWAHPANVLNEEEFRALLNSRAEKESFTELDELVL
jgi:hypothetical protein